MECYSAFPVTKRQETREMYKKLDQEIKKKNITPPNKKSYVSNEVKPVTHACRSLSFQISCI